MSPFEVKTDKNHGFAALSAGTATRLSLDMREVPVPYSVMTREFIDALGITNAQECGRFRRHSVPNVQRFRHSSLNFSRNIWFPQSGEPRPPTPNYPKSIFGASGW
jgi:hypothetical protein